MKCITANGKIMLVILTVMGVVCAGSPVLADVVWIAGEPDEGDAMPMNYSDSLPSGWGVPSEIFSMSLRDYTSDAGKFSFEIETNFGNLTERQNWDSSVPISLGDSYTFGVGLENFTAGGLYIRRIDRASLATTDLYEFTLEGRDGSSGDPLTHGKPRWPQRATPLTAPKLPVACTKWGQNQISLQVPWRAMRAFRSMSCRR